MSSSDSINDRLGTKPSYTGTAADVNIESDATKTIYGTEIIEIIPVGTTGGATIPSPVWLSTKDLVDGMIYAKGDSVTSSTAWTLIAHYSFDGVTEITTKIIATGTIAVATGAETISANFNQFDTTADAVGFSKLILEYPFIQFSLAFASGTAAGTCECKASVVRRNG